MTKVMLLEDDPTMLTLLETLLQIEGYSTSKVLNYENFMDEVKTFMPDIILMDVYLDNDNDGRELLKEIKTDEALSSIKVIMSSGSDLKNESLLLGADEFITKPYMPYELTTKIEDLISD